MAFSVLMSVYQNQDPRYLDKALGSIWSDQTLRPNQVVLVQDGPVPDALRMVVSRWRQRLGNLFEHVPLEQNVGLHHALNAGLEHCRYELVARMDTDDVSMPNRFEKQVTFMESHPDIAASSGQMEEWDPDMQRCLAVRRLPLTSRDLAHFAKTRSPLTHPAAIFRKSAVLDVGGYPDMPKTEDYALWSRLLVGGYSLANVSDNLLRMRTGGEMMGRRGGWRYFRQQLTLLRYQRRIGFLGPVQFVVNVVIQAVLRLSPRFLKSWMYRMLR